MRGVIIGLFLALAACGQAPTVPANQQPTAPAAIAFDAPGGIDRAAILQHGERLTRVLGCRGCHTPNLQGQQFYELYASNLTREVPRYTDVQLDRLIRHGERIDGRDLWGMPSEVFRHLDDDDYRALIAYLRTLTPAGAPTGTRLPWQADAARQIAAGTLKPAAATVATWGAPVDLGPNHALGRYIVMATCAECHGATLTGGDDAPDLIVASAYRRDEFERLLTTGVPTGGRTLGLMGEVARGRFAHLTRHERDAVYAYLKARAEQPR